MKAGREHGAAGAALPGSGCDFIFPVRSGEKATSNMVLLAINRFEESH